ncbi:MAG TPA: hypothetical protein VJ486_10610 [Geothrix sp.]|nr:hypothetical protein [Geothrix sp.]
MEDQELLDSGYSSEEIAVFESFSKAADSLAPELKTDRGSVWQALNTYYENYQWQILITEGVENAKQAKLKLRRLATASDELASSMLSLGQGAIEVLCRQTLRPDLFDAAEPAGLPDPRPWGNRHGSVFLGPQVEAPWITRLKALSDLARAKADRIEALTKKGGRGKTLGTRIHGSPEEQLAKDCGSFAEDHGCRTQAVILRMTQVIMEAARGKKWMERKKDTKPSPDKGRKAVRKMAQTKPG